MSEPCGTLVSERTITNKHYIALEQHGKHLVFEFGKFRMAECSCFGLSWFVWERVDVINNVGWFRLNATNRVLTVNSDLKSLSLEPHDRKHPVDSQLWSIVGNPGRADIRSQIKQNGHHLFLYASYAGKVGLKINPQTNNLWKIKHGKVI